MNQLLKKRILLPLLLALVLLGVWLWQQRPLFPDLAGPELTTRLPEPADFTLDINALPQSGTSSLALWINDTASSWYGIASGLSGLGVPFHVVTDVNEALQHKVILIYPGLSGASASPAALQALAAHVRNGGTLLAFSVLGGGMEPLFGFEQAVEVANHHALQFQPSALIDSFVQETTEAQVYLGSVKEPDSGLPGISYQNPKHPPIAVYDDGSAAITYNFFETETGSTGRAYALGVDVGHFILRAHNGRLPDVADTYVNAYQPKIDTLLRFIAAVYRQGEPDAVLLSPTPHGKDVTILMTHDIDFARSIANAPTYAAVEYVAGVPATYFIQTKYVKDYSDDYFLDPARSVYLQQLLALGMEVGSHSVAHSLLFDELAIGTGAEQYPDYHPFVGDIRKIEGASLTGELRVSSFLLNSLTGKQMVSFRPGHLLYPDTLPQLLSATGYRYSSSMTANEALTHLPFRAMYDRTYDKPVDIHEFPVTIEDEAGRLGDRTDAAIAVTNAIARYHGLVNVLVHTDSVDHKLDFTRRFIAEFKDRAWFSTVGNYGQWWQARESVALAVVASTPQQRRLTLTANGDIGGLTLLLPAGWRYSGGVDGSSQQGERLTLGEFTGNAVIDIQLQ